jgi:guanylate kinase
VDGRDYYFLSRPAFQKRERAGEFLETATYGGNRYGTLRSEVARLHGEGRHALLVIEVTGARKVRRRVRGPVEIFLLPPSGAELVRRLSSRNSESPEALAKRLAIAKRELGAVGEYDYVVVNGEVEAAAREISAILDAEVRRVTRRADLKARVQQLRREIAAAGKER